MQEPDREWWRDARCHFNGPVREDSSLLTRREDVRPAIEFMIRELNLSPSTTVLDLCCGPGRYATELAHQGLAVVGLDLNSEFITLARRLAEKEGVMVEYLLGDMREIPFVEHFDAVINLGTSFGFFDDDADNQRVFDAVANALKPYGSFLLEMGNRDYLVKNFTPKDWQRLDDGRTLLVSRTFDYLRGRINAFFETVDGEPKERWAHSWRAYTLAEVVSMLQHSGFGIAKLFGGLDGAAYGSDARRMVVIAQESGPRAKDGTKAGGTRP